MGTNWHSCIVLVVLTGAGEHVARVNLHSSWSLCSGKDFSELHSGLFIYFVYRAMV